MTGPRAKRKRGRGGSVPSPKERRTLWESIRTTSSYPPHQYHHRFLCRMIIACEYRVKPHRQSGTRTAGRKGRNLPENGEICREREAPTLSSGCCRRRTQYGIQSKREPALLLCPVDSHFRRWGEAVRVSDFSWERLPASRGRWAGLMRSGALIRAEDVTQAACPAPAVWQKVVREEAPLSSPTGRGIGGKLRLQCCGYTHRADKGRRMPEKTSICQIG